MKTAMQELIEWVNSKTQLFVPSKGQIIEKATELLKKEEEQIKKAWISGLNETPKGNAQNYFNQTYTNEAPFT